MARTFLLIPFDSRTHHFKFERWRNKHEHKIYIHRKIILHFGMSFESHLSGEDEIVGVHSIRAIDILHAYGIRGASKGG